MAATRRRENDADVTRTFEQRMVSAERCPIDGPCGQTPCSFCTQGTLHPCLVARHTARGAPVAKAVALALDAVRYPGPGETPLAPAATRVRLLSVLCREHARAAEAVLASPRRRRETLRAGRLRGAG